MARKFAALAFSCFSAGLLYAQLDWLTLREAESIVERIPEVEQARRDGKCPQLSATYGPADELWVQVRSYCGTAAGEHLDNYIVSRRTGLATTAGDIRAPVDSPKGRSLAARLIRDARSRILSADESLCLAREAAQSLSGWAGNDGSISVKPLGEPLFGERRFTAHFRSVSHPIDLGRELSVNPATGRVRDDQTGLDVMSEAVGALTSKMVALRLQPVLGDNDAASIVGTVPAVAEQLRNGCRLSVGGAFRSDEALVGVSCEGHGGIGSTTVAVNIRTGQMTDADTGKTIESPGATRLADELLDRSKQWRSKLDTEISAACGQH